MKLSEAGIAIIKKYEGCRYLAYQDGGGVWTIGYGFTKGVKFGMSMSPEECERRLQDEVCGYEEAVLKACIVPPTQHQFDALVSLSWNIGIAGLSRSTVIRLHNQKDFVNASRAFNMWNQDNGKVVQGLVNRRAAEAALYLS